MASAQQQQQQSKQPKQHEQQLKTVACSRPVNLRIPRLCRQQHELQSMFSHQSVVELRSKSIIRNQTIINKQNPNTIVNSSSSNFSSSKFDLNHNLPNSSCPIGTLASTNEETNNTDSHKTTIAPQLIETNSRRVPTFGRTPEQTKSYFDTLQSTGATSSANNNLPYFAYNGRARNVDLVRPTDRPHHRNLQLSTGISTSTSKNKNNIDRSSSSSSLSQSQQDNYDHVESASHSSSADHNEILSRPNKLSSGDNNHTNHNKSRRTVATLLRRGYSNISNLFPDKPQMTKTNHRSSSVDLSNRQAQQQQQQQYNNSANTHSSSATLTKRQGRQTSRSTLDLSAGPTTNKPAIVRESSMIRQNNLHNNNSNNNNSNNNLNSNQTNSNLQQRYHKQRPVSATGLRRRSPSTSSLYHSRPTQRPHYVGAWTYELDPDCPVHGQSGGPCSPGGAAAAATAASMSRSSQHLATTQQQQQQQQQQYQQRPTKNQITSVGMSAADLLYADADGATDHQLVHTSRRGGSLYSPSSPLGWRDQTNQAYYNNASRFSLYSNTTDSGRPRSSLAPAQEQVRRILGYQPRQLLEPKPVYLHPQWAYNRPFIHLLGVRSASSLSTPENYLDDDEYDEGGDDNDDDNDYGDGDDVIGGGPRRRRDNRPRFAAFNQLQDAQAIRAVDFHPSGEVYAIGSNSRALRICAYPAVRELKQFSGEDQDETGEVILDQEDHQQGILRKQRLMQPTQPRVLFKFLQVHRGSIYCVAFNPSGQLLATGSNDQTVHLVRYNPQTHTPDGEEFRLSMHDGTVRELCFIDDSGSGSAGSSLLLSAGGGDNKIYVTDCETVTPFQSMAGHTQMVMGLHHVGGAQFVSCSQDRTIRFWDLRTRNCTSIISAPAAPLAPEMGGPPGTQSVANDGKHRVGGGFIHEPIVPAKPGPGAPVCAVRADPTGRLLVSGHSDATCMLYDIRASRIIQAFRPHRDEVRSVSFSPRAHYMLTGGYDGRLVLTDLQGDLSQAMPSVCVAECGDKVVQAKWHPTDYTFVSTSADRTATLWALPAQI